MSTVIDELITKYTLDEKGYAANAKKVIDVTQHIGHAATEAAARVHELGKKISEKFKVGELLAPLAALGTITGLVDLGKDAWNTAAKFDVLERKIAGVTGSLERAKAVMEFGEKESNRFGLFKPEELDEAATRLEAFGLKAEKHLPTVEKLSAIFGKGAEGLDLYTEALGKISEGQGQRAMMILAGAGISKKDLEKHGVLFNGRTPVSAPDKIINAIEGIAEEKYGGVRDQFENSPEARAGRMANAWERALRKVGTGIQSVLLPYVDQIGKSLTQIVDSGQLDRIVNGFAKLFGSDTTGVGDAIQKIGDWLEGLPERIEKFWKDVKPGVQMIFDWITKALGFLESNFKTLGEIWLGLWAFGKVKKGIEEVAGLVKLIKGSGGLLGGAAGGAAKAAGAAGSAAAGGAASAAASVAGGAAGGAAAGSAAGGVAGGAAAAAAGIGLGTIAVYAAIAAAVIALLKVGYDQDTENHLQDAYDKGGDDAVNNLKDFSQEQKEEFLNRKHGEELDDSIKRFEAWWNRSKDPAGERKALLDALPKEWNFTSADVAGFSPEDRKMLLDTYAPDWEKKKKDAESNAAEPVGPDDEMQTKYLLEQIANNTKNMQLDLRRYAFGGGDLGKIGVTPIEMEAMRGGHNRGLRPIGSGMRRSIHAAVLGSLDDLINDAVGNHMNNLVRSGMLPTR